MKRKIKKFKKKFKKLKKRLCIQFLEREFKKIKIKKKSRRRKFILKKKFKLKRKWRWLMRLRLRKNLINEKVSKFFDTFFSFFNILKFKIKYEKNIINFISIFFSKYLEKNKFIYNFFKYLILCKKSNKRHLFYTFQNILELKEDFKIKEIFFINFLMFFSIITSSFIVKIKNKLKKKNLSKNFFPIYYKKIYHWELSKFLKYKLLKIICAKININEVFGSFKALKVEFLLLLKFFKSINFFFFFFLV